MFIRIWDKKEPINGVNAKEVLDSMPFLKGYDDIILMIDNYGVVKRIEISEILKNELNLDSSLNALDVGNAYIQHMEEQTKKAEENKEVQNQLTQNQEERIKSLENTILELKEVI